MYLKRVSTATSVRPMYLKRVSTLNKRQTHVFQTGQQAQQASDLCILNGSARLKSVRPMYLKRVSTLEKRQTLGNRAPRQKGASLS